VLFDILVIMDIDVEQSEKNVDAVSATVTRNALYLTGALVIQKFISFFYFTFIARYTGVNITEEYLFPLSFATIFSVIADFGFTPVVVREVAKHKERAQQIFSTALFFRLLLSVAALLVMIAAFFTLNQYVRYIGISDLSLRHIMIAGTIMILDTTTLLLFALFRGHQRLEYEAIASVINRVIVATIGFFAAIFTKSVALLLGAILVGSVFNIIYATYLLRARLGIRLSPRWSREYGKGLLAAALPFAFTALCLSMYNNFDVVLLRLQPREGAVAWYGVAYKLTFTLQFIPAALAASLFPAMSEQFVRDKEKVAELFRRSVVFLSLIAMPLSVGLFLIAYPLVLFMYDDAFSASATPFQFLILSLVPIFLNFPVGYLLNAAGKQHINTINTALVTVLSIGLNLWLIPLYTFNGAAITALICGWTLFILGALHVVRLIPLRTFSLFVQLGKVATASIIMGVPIYLLRMSLGDVISDLIRGGGIQVSTAMLHTLSQLLLLLSLVTIGGMTYIIALLVLRSFTTKDLQVVTQFYSKLMPSRHD
jgi:O-antigen/teichoic acid export membrane protein